MKRQKLIQSRMIMQNQVKKHRQRSFKSSVKNHMEMLSVSQKTKLVDDLLLDERK